MTGYALLGSNGGDLGMKAGSFEVRILRLEIWNNTSVGTINGEIQLFSAGMTLSGGTEISGTPLRGGSTAASATGRTGSVTAGGTWGSIGKFSTAVGAIDHWEPASDLIMPVGAGLFIDGYNPGGSSGYMQYTFLFEELRLSWHK